MNVQQIGAVGMTARCDRHLDAHFSVAFMCDDCQVRWLQRGMEEYQRQKAMAQQPTADKKATC